MNSFIDTVIKNNSSIHLEYNLGINILIKSVENITSQ